MTLLRSFLAGGFSLLVLSDFEYSNSSENRTVDLVSKISLYLFGFWYRQWELPLKFGKVKRKTIETGISESHNCVDFRIMKGGASIIQTIITTPRYGDDWSDDKI